MYPDRNLQHTGILRIEVNSFTLSQHSTTMWHG